MHQLAIGGQDLGAALVLEHQRAAEDHRPDGMQGELELGDHAEVAAASAQAPEQVRVLVLARADDAAVGGHDGGGHQVVGGQAVHALEPAGARAEREPGHAGVRDAPAGHREPVRLRRGVELRPGEAGAGAHGARGQIDLDALHRPDVDDEAVVDDAVAGAGVAAGAYGDRQAALAAVRDGRRDVAGVGRLGDQRRVAVDGTVVDGAGVVVALVARREDGAGEVLDVAGCNRHADSVS